MVLLSLAVVIWFSYPMAMLFETFVGGGLWSPIPPAKRYCKGVFKDNLAWIWEDIGILARPMANPFGVKSLWEGKKHVYSPESSWGTFDSIRTSYYINY